MIEAGFIVIRDRNEKDGHGYDFKGIFADTSQSKKPQILNVPVENAVLVHGDYTLKGFEDTITVERKSKTDLVSSIVSRHAETKRKIGQISYNMKHAAIVVEATLADVIQQCDQKSAKTIFRTTISWSFRFSNVHFFFMSNRREAEICTFRWLERYWRIVNGDVK